MKYLGIDYGLKKSGLALGDSEAGIAVPLDVIPGGEETLRLALELVAKEGIEGFVVGLPLPTSPQQSETQLERTMAFIQSLVDASGLPVYVVDEQFSSAEARRVQKESGSNVKEDALAAMLILQAYFDEGAL